MPDQRLENTRATLPTGYQYGDAGKPAIRIRFLKAYDIAVSPADRARNFPTLAERIQQSESR